jgi:hypothetical protein
MLIRRDVLISHNFSRLGKYALVMGVCQIDGDAAEGSIVRAQEL